MGRRLLIAPEGVEKIKETVAAHDRSIDSFDGKGIQKLIVENFKEQKTLSGSDSFIGNVAMSTSSKKRYHKMIAPDFSNSAVARNPTRQRAVREIPNAIGLAAFAKCFEHYSPAFLLNEDTVGVELGSKKGEKFRVYLAEGSRRDLKSRKLQPGIKKKAQQYRVVHLHATHSAQGEIIHVAIKIVDSSFKTMEIFEIDSNVAGMCRLSVFHLPTNYDQL